MDEDIDDLSKSGTLWSAEEYIKLIASYIDYASIDTIARQHGRSSGAIEKALMNVGLYTLSTSYPKRPRESSAAMAARRIDGSWTLDIDRGRLVLRSTNHLTGDCLPLIRMASFNGAVRDEFMKALPVALPRAGAVIKPAPFSNPSPLSKPKQPETLEIDMTAPTINNLTMICGRDASTMTDEEVLRVAADLSARISHLQKMDVASKKKDAMIEKLKTDRDAVVEYLDGR